MIQVHCRRKRGRPLQLYYVDPLTQREVSRSSGTSDIRQAERAAADWQRELNARGEPGKLSWDEFVCRHEDERIPTLSSGARSAVQAAFGHLERTVGHPAFLRAVDAAVLSQMTAKWRREGMVDSTIGAYLGHLRAAFGWAVRIGLLEKCPRFQMPKLSGRLMRGRAITIGEARQIARATRGVVQPWRPWVRFQRCLWLSGLRLHEAIRLSWDAGPVQVQLTGGKFPQLRFLAAGHKARRDQLAPITPEFARWLQRVPVDQRHGPVVPLPSEARKKRIVSVKRVGRVLSEIGRAAGVVTDADTGQHATAHDYRRAFGTRWAQKVRPVTLKALMRHKTIQTTLKYYVDLDADDVAEELWR